MPQVRVTFLAQHFRPPHAISAIGLSLDVLLVDRGKETGPPGSRFKLGVRAEERIATANAAIHAFIVQLVVLAGERPFGALLPGDRILLGSQLLLPLFIRLDHFVGHVSILNLTCGHDRNFQSAPALTLGLWSLCRVMYHGCRFMEVL